MSTNNDTIVQHRRQRCRPILSCTACRERKVKCDRDTPCRNCVRLKTTCVYPPSVGRTNAIQQDSSRSQQLSDARHQREPHDLHSLSHQQATTAEPDNPLQSLSADTRPSYSAHTVGSFHLTQDGATRALENARSIRALTQQSAALQPEPTVDPTSNISKQPIATNQISPPRDTFLMNKTRMFGRSHWMHLALQLKFTDKFLSSNDPVDLDIDPEIPESMLTEIRALFRRCKSLARASKASRLTKQFIPLQPSMIRPSREIADALITLYLTRFESAFRILHIPSFQSEYATFWDDRAPFNEALHLKVYLVMAIGASLYRNDPVDVAIRQEAREWIYAAHSWTAGPFEKSRLTLDGLQVQCLLILARQALSVGKDLLWVSLGTLVRCAMQMGLHRDPDHFVSMSVPESELRRRLWATIMELNVQSSLDSGMPPTQSLESFDTKCPTNLNDEDLVNPDSASSRNLEDHVTDTSVQIILFHTLRPRIDMLSALNGSQTGGFNQSMLTWSSQIVDACSQLHRAIRGVPKSQATSFRLRLAIYFLRRFLLPLSGLIVKLLDTDPSKHYAKKICFDSVLAILPSRQEGDYHLLMQIGSGMFIRGFHHAVLALSLELQTDVFGGESDTTHRNQNSYQELFLGLFKDAQALTTERLTVGETNVKWEVLVSMIIGQINATVQNIPVKLSVAKAAKDSLEHCLQILRYRSATSQQPHDTWDSEQQSNYDDELLQPISAGYSSNPFPAMNFFATSPDIWPALC